MNTGNTYYLIDDFNKICKCENGMKTDESIILETYELVDDINRLVEENEQLKEKNEELKSENAKMKKELSLLAEFNQKPIL